MSGINFRILKKDLLAYAFIAPYFSIFLAFLVIPGIASFVISLFRYEIVGVKEFIGLENFQELFESEVFWLALRNTVYYIVLAVPSTVVLGLLLAMMFNIRFRGRTVGRLIVFLPLVVAVSAMGTIWRWLYDGNFGMLNYYLGRFGFTPISWLGSKQVVIPAIVLASVWWGVGFQMIIFLAALQGIPKELYEVARIDGASKITIFRCITLPLLRPATFFVVLISIIGSFRVFGQIYVMTQGGPAHGSVSLVVHIFQKGFVDFRMGYASAVAVVLVAVVAGISVLQFKIIKSTLS